MSELQITAVSKTYANGVRAVDDVTLRISTGMFGLLGPNGAGKSTLMRTIATLQEPDTGTIKLGDIDVLEQKDELRKRLGYLPQEFGVYPKVSAGDMLSHIAVLKGITDRKQRKQVVDALLHQTNLHDVRKKKLGSYSGGMKQRFGIAQALLGDPQLIIVDEPTAGLDPAERLRFLNLLGEIGRDIVVILSTHIVDDVSELCSEMAIMADGQVRLTGRPADAIAALRGRIWQREVAREQLADIEAEHPVISTSLRAGRIVVHVISDSAGATPGPGFEAVEPDLKDVYFSTLRDAEQVAAHTG